MKNTGFLILLPLLLLNSCTLVKVNQEDFENAILNIEEYQYDEATIKVEATFKTEGKEDKESSTEKFNYDYKKDSWGSDFFASYLEPLKKNGTINDKSTYQNFCETIDIYQDYSFYLKPFKITAYINQDIGKYRCTFIYNSRGYLTSFLLTDTGATSKSASKDATSYSKLEYSISYR